MKFYWTMPGDLKVHYRRELKKYEDEISNRNLELAWRQLERAHILAQAWPREHTGVHWLMLKFGIKIKSRRFYM